MQHSQQLKKENSKGANYKSPEDVKGAKKLCYMIQENAYWNNYLYRSCSKVSSAAIYTIFAGIGLALLLIFPAFIRETSYSIVRIGLVVISFIITLELQNKARMWHYASEAMEAIDNHLRNITSSPDDVVEKNVMLIYSNYSTAKLIAPSIPDVLYKLNRKKLNDGWAQRVKESSQNK